MTRPSPEEVLGETARLAYHLHWPLDTILDLEHHDRRRFLRDADAIAADLRERPILADELQRALRPRVETMQRQRNGNLYWLIALGRAQQDPRIAAAIAARIADYEGVTAADLQRAARTFLQPGRAWKLVIVPREGAPAS